MNGTKELLCNRHSNHHRKCTTQSTHSFLFFFPIADTHGTPFLILDKMALTVKDPETVKMMVDLVEPKCVVTQPESRSKYV